MRCLVIFFFGNWAIKHDMETRTIRACLASNVQFQQPKQLQQAQKKQLPGSRGEAAALETAQARRDMAGGGQAGSSVRQDAIMI